MDKNKLIIYQKGYFYVLSREHKGKKIKNMVVIIITESLTDRNK